MTELIPIALYGWIAIAILLFALLKPRSALLVTVVGAWLFLPAVRLETKGFLDFDRRLTASLGMLLGVLLFDGARLLAFRPRWYDLPILCWCVAPFCSSLSNDLGFYDGAMSALAVALTWGVPYLLGRLYFATPDGLAELARATFIGGVLYAPLCLWEVRMSPTLHRYVYGVEVYGGIRYLEELGAWGSRPSVFLANPLELGIYLTAACMCGVALWMAGQPRRIGPLPTVLLLLGLLAVTLLCKNLGATVLLLGGAAVLYVSLRWRSAWLLWLLAFLPPTYALVRGTGTWSAAGVVDAVSLLHEGRAQSFEFRLENENILIDKALERPLLGWGGWGRSRVYDEMGNDRSVTDGSWVIALGKTGLFGLASLLAAFAVPVLRSMRGLPRGAWRLPALIPAIALAVTACLYAVDGLFNNFPNPLLVLSLGGLAGLGPLRFQSPARAPAEPAQAVAEPLAS